MNVGDLDHLLRASELARERCQAAAGRRGSRLRASAYAGGALCSATARNASPSRRYKRAELGLANARRIRQHRLEYRLQLAGRAGDDAQHLRGRGLLLQRLAQIIGALPQLVKQPRVLDGDHRLLGEIVDQFDLLVGERPDFLAVDDY